MKRVSNAIASVHGRRFQYGPASVVICKSIVYSRTDEGFCGEKQKLSASVITII